MVAIRRSPLSQGWQIPIRPPDTYTLDQMIVRDLGDRVTLTVAPTTMPTYTDDFTIQQIRHDVSAIPGQAARHVTTWGVSSLPVANPFVFGTSMFGSTDELAY
jgi:hypothetical protein